MSIAVALVIISITAVAMLPASAANFGGTVDFYTVVSNSCSSSNPVWPVWAYPGVGPTPTVTSNGPAGDAPVIDEGASICVVVDLNGLTPGTQTVTSPGFSGSFTVSVDSSGHGTGSGILTDNSSGNAASCATHPIFITGTAGPGGQIFHVLLATQSGETGCSTTTLTTTMTTTMPTSGVPEFPIAGSIGLLLVVAIALPLLVAARKWRAPTRTV